MGTHDAGGVVAGSRGYRGISTVGLRWYGYNAEQSGGMGAALKAQLNDIIDDHVVFSCDAARSILQVTDADPATPGNMLTVDNRVSFNVAAINPARPIPGWDGGVSWNREHTWPDSCGLGGTGLASSDLHHLRPATLAVNSSRGNKSFGGAHGQSYGVVADSGDLW